jgi:hypothetical protein
MRQKYIPVIIIIPPIIVNREGISVNTKKAIRLA